MKFNFSFPLSFTFQVTSITGFYNFYQRCIFSRQKKMFLLNLIQSVAYKKRWFIKEGENWLLIVMHIVLSKRWTFNFVFWWLLNLHGHASDKWTEVSVWVHTLILYTSNVNSEKMTFYNHACTIIFFKV